MKRFTLLSKKELIKILVAAMRSHTDTRDIILKLLDE
jgi:hypothetical protein